MRSHDTNDPSRDAASQDWHARVGSGHTDCVGTSVRRRGSALGLLVVTLAFSLLGAAWPAPARAEADPSPTLREVADAAGFRIGAAGVTAEPEFADLVPRHFNSVTPENLMKWPALAPDGPAHAFSAADAFVDYAESRDLRVRGHNLVWGKYAPAWLEAEVGAADDPAALMERRIENHVSETVGRYAGRIYQWDVVNEPVTILGFTPESIDAHTRPSMERNIFFDTLGEAYLDIAFRAARAADPEAELFLNEQLLFVDYAGPRGRYFLDLLDRLVADGVPIDGVGIQAHVMVGVAAVSRLGDFIDAIGDRGLAVELTELDTSRLATLQYLLSGRGWPALFRGGIPAVQADIYRAVAGACLEREHCTGITVWGVDDAHTWLDAGGSVHPFGALRPNRPLLFDASTRPKPAYFAVRDLIGAQSSDS